MKRYDLGEALDLVELPEYKEIFGNRKYPDLKDIVDEFKEKLRKKRKVLAKKYHPDVNPDGEKDFKEINRIIDTLLTIKVRPPKRRYVTVRVQPTYSYTNFTGNYYDTSATTF